MNRPIAGDWTLVGFALVIHAVTLAVVVGLFGLVRPGARARTSPVWLLFALQFVAAVLAGLAQVYAMTQIRELNPPFRFAFGNRLYFFGVPGLLHVATLVGLWLAWRRTPADLQDDYSDTDLHRHRDVTPPRVRRTDVSPELPSAEAAEAEPREAP